MMMLKEAKYLVWNAGHTEIKSPGEQSYEESKLCWHPDNNHVLHSLWLSWLCSFWKWCTGQFPYWFWILRAFRANWHRKCMHSYPPYWCLPGKALPLKMSIKVVQFIIYFGQPYSKMICINRYSASQSSVLWRADATEDGLIASS